MTRLTAILIFAFTWFGAFSQKILSLQEALEKSIQQSKSLQIQSYESEIASSELDKLQAMQLPHVNLSHQYLITNDPLNAFGFKLQQSSIQGSDFNPELLNNPDVAYYGNTKLTFRQALLHIDPITLKKGFKAKLEAKQWQQKRAEDKIKLELKNAYSDLQYLYAALDVSQHSLKTFSEHEKNIKNLVTQGLAMKTDELALHSERNQVEIQITQIKHSVENLSAFIAFLIGESLTSVYVPVSTLTLDSTLTEKITLTERADFKAMQAGIEARNYFRKSGQQGFIPKLNAFGEFNLYDKNIFGTANHAYLAGVQLQWDLFNGNGRSYDSKKQKLEIGKAQLEKELALDQAHLESNKANNELSSAKEEFALAQKNVLISEEQKRIITDRFLQGLKKTSDLLDAELKLMDKKLKVMEAIGKHNKTIQFLEFLHTSSTH